FFADPFFALGPERFRAFAIERVGAHAAAEVKPAGLRDLGYLAIFAIPPANIFRVRYDAGPNRCRRALRNSLELVLLLACGNGLLVQMLKHRLDRAFGHVTAKLGADAARMHRNAANAAIAPAPVKLYREQHVCGLCATVSHPRLILGALEVRIVEIDIAAA